MTEINSEQAADYLGYLKRRADRRRSGPPFSREQFARLVSDRLMLDEPGKIAVDKLLELCDD